MSEAVVEDADESVAEALEARHAQPSKADLTDRPAHDLDLGRKRPAATMLTDQRLGTIRTRKSGTVDPY